MDKAKVRYAVYPLLDSQYVR